MIAGIDIFYIADQCRRSINHEKACEIAVAFDADEAMLERAQALVTYWRLAAKR